MALPLGTISGPGEDSYASTGPHLDIRVVPGFGKDQGRFIDPAKFARTQLQKVLVDGKPLVSQQDGDFTFNFPITSNFGPRKAPTAGASTMHRGTDFAIPAGAQISFAGGGVAQQGGSNKTMLNFEDEEGRPYSMRFLHVNPEPTLTKDKNVYAAKPDPNAQTTKTQNPVPGGYTQSQVLEAYLKGILESREKEESFGEKLQGQILGGLLSEAMGGSDFLDSYTKNDPFLSGRRAATGNYLQGMIDKRLRRL